MAPAITRWHWPATGRCGGTSQSAPPGFLLQGPTVSARATRGATQRGAPPPPVPGSGPAAEPPRFCGPEREVRTQIERLANAAAREHALEALDRFEAAREAVAAARSDNLVPALEAFDDTFFQLTGARPERPEGRAGGRTALFLDCTRDLQ